MKASSVLVLSVAIATLVPVSLAVTGLGIPSQTPFGVYANGASRIEDSLGDARPVLQESNTTIVPEVKAYHDIVGASIRKLDDSYLFTIELAGNPNQNEKYETNYVWHVISESTVGKEQHSIVMFPNFAPDSNFTSKGWHYAVYDAISESYVVPQTKIQGIPDDRVEYQVEDYLIGSPSSFRYWVSIYVRVDAGDLAKPPDYLMDYAP